MAENLALPLDDLLAAFVTQQREQLLLAVDALISDAIQSQGKLLDEVRGHVQARHAQSVDRLKAELNDRELPILETLTRHTLSLEGNRGLFSWIESEARQTQAKLLVDKMRNHLMDKQGKEFREDFEALLVVYMEYLKVPMERGSRLINRIEDFREALHQKAGFNDVLTNLVDRVRWACDGVRVVGNIRSQSGHDLSESECLELCGCLSAIGAAMPTLALEFEACKPSANNLIPSGLISDPGADLAKLIRQATNSNGEQASLDSSSLEMLLKLVTKGNGTSDSLQSPASPLKLSPTMSPPGLSRSTSLPDRGLSSPLRLNRDMPPLPPGYGSSFSQVRSQPPLPPGFDSPQSMSPPLPPDDFGSFNRISSNGSSFLSTQTSQPLSLSLDFNSTSSMFGQAPPLPSGYSSVIGQPASHSPLPLHPPLPPGTGSPQKQSPVSYGTGSPQKQSPLPPGASPQKKSPHPQQPGAFAMKQSNVPSQALLKLVPEFKFYYDRPTELPRESDRVRMAMFARMINHMNALPKATLCPYQQSHDLTCPLSHTYMEVMAYNPLYKRLVCRQTSHYWGNQVQEDVNCVCLHVDTGLDWDWLNEDKRMYCLQGSKCSNKKCVKSHSFVEMCWYNPSYKIKKCDKRIHDHIARARGTIAPPLDCTYYHIEEGKNCDRREFMVEGDHVGQDIKMLFVERSHKPLAERLEALRYVRDNNL